jgi:hypothetical protein
MLILNTHSYLPRHICVPAPTQDIDFQRHILLLYFMFNDLRWEVIVRFVDICVIVDNYCLYFLISIAINNHRKYIV